MNPDIFMDYAFIEYATRDTTADTVKTAFEERFGLVVDRIDESITQGYTEYWKSFTIYFKESCEVGKHLPFHKLFDRYVLYYSSVDYWDVHWICKRRSLDMQELNNIITYA